MQITDIGIFLAKTISICKEYKYAGKITFEMELFDGNKIKFNITNKKETTI